MRYLAKLTKEQGSRIAEFPDCPGCVTQADRGEDVEAMASEALEGWLQAEMKAGRVPPEAKAKGAGLLVAVTPKLAIKIALRRARSKAGLKQTELAERAGLSQTAIARLEDPDWNSSFDTMEKVANALGVELEVSFRKAG